MREVAEDERLTIVERGNRSVIDTFFEEGLEGSPFAGNIVDICPVGALVSKDFLHKARAWDLDHTPSVCPSCSQGCNISLHTRDDLVQRLKPRENLEVNGWWMCDFGRHNYEWINRGDRQEAPLVRGPSGMKAVGWADALQSLLERLREVDGGVRAVSSAHASNEEMGLLKALVEALGGGEILYRSPRAEDELPLPGYPLLVRRRDLAPNVRGAEILGFRRVGSDDSLGGLEEVGDHKGPILVVGDELSDQPETFGSQSSLFAYLGAYTSSGAGSAEFNLPLATFAEQEGTFTNAQGRVQRFWPGIRAPGAARPGWLVLGALLAELTGGTSPSRADEAFSQVAGTVPEFEDLSYGSMGTQGAPVKQPSVLSGD
jgi:NADH-quinone oxidoreductase subunit G